MNNVKGNQLPRLSRSLAAYAFVADTVRAGGDLTQGVMQFFAAIAKDKSGERFVPAEFCQEVAERFGMHVPTIVAVAWAERLAKAHLLTKIREGAGLAEYNYAAPDRLSQYPSEAKIEQILGDFRSVVADHADLVGTMSDAEIDRSFFDRLLTVDSMKILRKRDGTIPKKEKPNTLTLKRPTESSEDKEVRFDYLWASYIGRLEANDLDKFDTLADIAFGNLAAEALLSYRDPPNAGESLQNLDVFVDAPLVLDLLNLNGDERFNYANELRELLLKSGARIYVFQHSVDEIERIVTARLQTSRTGNRLGTGYYSVETPLTIELLGVLQNQVSTKIIEELKFAIQDTNRTIPTQIKARVDAQDEELIRSKLAGYASEEARQVDTRSICDIIRLRSALEFVEHVTKSRALMVTRNPRLAEAAAIAWKSYLSDRVVPARVKRIAPVCISDKQLAGILWLILGGAVVANLPRARLIANCGAAVAVRRDVITKAYNVLLDIDPQQARTFEAVVTDERAVRAAMQFALADPDVITQDNVLELAEVVRQATASEVAAAKERQFESERTALRTERDAAIAESERLRAELNKSAERRDARIVSGPSEGSAKRGFSPMRVAVVIVAIVLVTAVIGLNIWSPNGVPPAAVSLSQTTRDAIAACSGGLDSSNAGRFRARVEEVGGNVGAELGRAERGQIQFDGTTLQLYENYLRCIDSRLGTIKP